MRNNFNNPYENIMFERNFIHALWIFPHPTAQKDAYGCKRIVALYSYLTQPTKHSNAPSASTNPAEPVPIHPLSGKALRRPINNSKRTKGFTLIELLIVITIIGILTVVLIPNLLDT
ncbi:hypothetical protein Deima_0039 [Deinococcus maricopensis DSM 21211]|uniref:Prepilin-type N-terminal cleavage/methylation domain-containing protein n=1 Tax=Deinococcus maricopensis (strain DSM 21211 / LMG 22137 / NRRL B-23946 / LB-34) TaxID=709986 RepID=E8U409_DEIML|nr:hypothetical protein Deima_0039 [Deinococcus maricopensis DSM 21211]